MSDDRGSLAQDRTELAEDRTILAHERSFASWMRTGMAAVGIGIGFNAIFDAIEPRWIPKAIASVILALGIVIFASAERRACRVIANLDEHEVSAARPGNLRLISFGMIAATCALLAAVWLMEWR